ncbi:hypothetical protein [Victivallis sp. Marseille-Q1083]|uniref:hypothetical protein n=1 Tax=Victivallis sp. Marseille-Q1083 TaxID=2717288 RepID=UPI00158E81B0|nr:hypothetical protein [Victivallis sp. Marseille-Q1083]
MKNYLKLVVVFLYGYCSLLLLHATEQNALDFWQKKLIDRVDEQEKYSIIADSKEKERCYYELFEKIEVDLRKYQPSEGVILYTKYFQHLSCYEGIVNKLEDYMKKLRNKQNKDVVDYVILIYCLQGLDDEANLPEHADEILTYYEYIVSSDSNWKDWAFLYRLLYYKNLLKIDQHIIVKGIAEEIIFTPNAAVLEYEYNITRVFDSFLKDYKDSYIKYDVVALRFSKNFHALFHHIQLIQNNLLFFYNLNIDQDDLDLVKQKLALNFDYWNEVRKKYSSNMEKIYLYGALYDALSNGGGKQIKEIVDKLKDFID